MYIATRTWVTRDIHILAQFIKYHIVIHIKNDKEAEIQYYNFWNHTLKSTKVYMYELSLYTHTIRGVSVICKYDTPVNRLLAV